MGVFEGTVRGVVEMVDSVCVCLCVCAGEEAGGGKPATLMAATGPQPPRCVC